MNEANESISTSGSSEADALAVVQRLREAGYVAYFAGGCVRDMLLGLAPKDFDVATDAPPGRVRELFRNTQAVGAAFGVILVRVGKSVIEVATFRTDLKYVDGRRPEGVVFTTAEEDAKRRDFTINGMFYDPVGKKVIDYVGGQADLKGKVLRAIGEPNHRFEEDHLRLLRAVRFAARFGLSVHSTTAQAIKIHAEQLKGIVPERVGEELRKMLTSPTRGEAFVLLRQLGLRDVVMRFLPEKFTHRRDEAFNIFLAVGDSIHRETISFGLALAVLTLDFRMHASGNYDALHWLAVAEARRSCQAMRQALKISNEEYDAMAGAMAVGHLVGDAPPTIAVMKRFLARRTSGDARLLLSALSSCGVLSARIDALLVQLDELEKTDFAPAPFVTGDDLTAAGLSPGPAFKRVLDAVYDAQLEGRVRSKSEAVSFAISIISH